MAVGEHLPTTEVNRFDIREVGFLSDDELRPALSERFRRAGIAYQVRGVRFSILGDGAGPTMSPPPGLPTMAASISSCRSRAGPASGV